MAVGLRSHHECDDIEAEPASYCLDISHLQHGSVIANVGQDRQVADAREDLAQRPEPS
jgi:hypothetical protein